MEEVAPDDTEETDEGSPDRLGSFPASLRKKRNATTIRTVRDASARIICVRRRRRFLRMELPDRMAPRFMLSIFRSWRSAAGRVRIFVGRILPEEGSDRFGFWFVLTFRMHPPLCKEPGDLSTATSMPAAYFTMKPMKRQTTFLTPGRDEVIVPQGFAPYGTTVAENENYKHNILNSCAFSPLYIVVCLTLPLLDDIMTEVRDVSDNPVLQRLRFNIVSEVDI